MVSVYLRHSEGLSQENQAILEELCVVLLQLSGPWIVAGDGNLSPAVLADSSWLRTIRGVIFATPLPNDSTYDFFVVHRQLAQAVAGVQRIEDGGACPHFYSRLLVRGDAKRFAVRKLVRAPKVSDRLPFGPAAVAPSYSSMEKKNHTLIGSQMSGVPVPRASITLEGATRNFYKLARTEWSGIAGEDLGFTPHRFRWESPIGQVAKPWTGSSQTSVMWRSLARRAQEVTKVLSRDSPSSWMQAAAWGHLVAAPKAYKSLCNSKQEELRPSVIAWAESLRGAWCHASVAWATSLWRIADIKAKKLEAAVAASKASHWRQAVGASAASASDATPTRLAYRWIKGIRGWQKSPVGPSQLDDQVPDEDDDGAAPEQLDGQAVVPSTDQSEDLEVPMSDQAAVDSEAEMWAALWQEAAQYQQPIFGAGLAPMQTMLPEAIVVAAESFPTGLGADNIAPRAFARLSSQALVALAALFMAFEAQGKWCEVLNLVLIVLLPKSSGGFRPIGLFPTVIRIWMRARYGLARAWQATHSLPVTFGGVGGSAPYAAWQAAMTAECAALDHLDHVQALIDLVKAFETVPHHILVRFAIARGYPVVLLRLSLASYRLVRSVGVDGVYSRCIVATRGITAGAGFATVELEVLLFDTILGLQAWSPTLVVKVFIDDITLAACGLPRVIIRVLVEALDFLVQQLEVHLRMLVSDGKSKVLAGRPSIAAAVLKAIESDKLALTRHGKLLGTDTVGGRRRSTITFLERVQTFSEARPRIHALRRVGVNSAQIVRTAGTPAVMYGCEVMGLSDSALHLARSRLSSAAGAPSGGKNVDLLLHAIDGPSGTLDPAFDAHATLVLIYAIAVWQAWFSREQFELAFQQASLKLAAKEHDSWWGLVTGPITALLASLRRIGWSMPNAFEVVDDLGGTWFLGSDSPGAIAATCKDAVRRWRLSRIGTFLPGLIPDSCDVGAPVCSGGTILVDMSGWAHPYLHGIRTGARLQEDWDPKWRQSLFSAAVCGQWTQVRKAVCRGGASAIVDASFAYNARVPKSTGSLALPQYLRKAGPSLQPVQSLR